MKIFICYARADKGFCTPLAEKIDNHEVWYDARIFAGQNWWQEILRRLNACDVMVFLISPSSVQSTYCLSELHIALRLGKRVLPVLLVPNVQPPDAIAHLHYADLTEGLTQENIKAIHSALFEIELELKQQSETQPQRHTRGIAELTPKELEHPVSVVDEALLSRAFAAMDKGNYDQAVFWVKTAIERGMSYNTVDLHDLLRLAEEGLARQEARVTMIAEYRVIADMFRYPAVRTLAVQSFLRFADLYPDYDPQRLAALVRQHNSEVTPSSVSQPNLPSAKPKAGLLMARLPLLKWQRIKAGGGVMAFDMAVFPTTNAQYRVFLHEGYANPHFWNYSPFASDWFEKYGRSVPKVKGEDDHPVTNVCWFEAMAYALWLGEMLKRDVRLPTQAQWRRAAQGDDGRAYSFGNEFSKELCNSLESGIRRTTPVTRYRHAASPFGIYDMCGNVWELCINSEGGSGDLLDIEANAPRAILGGAFNTRQEKLRVTFNFFVDPTYKLPTIGFRVIAHL